MKIGIDARMIGPECGGIGRYIEQLILHLNEIDGENQYVLFIKKIRTYEKLGENFKRVYVDVPWYGFKEQLFFNKIIKKEKLDLMHFPHWNVPLFYNDPFVVTIHDLLLMHYPTRESSTLGPVSYWFKNLAYKIVLKHAVQKAKHILTTSEYTKQDIFDTLKASPDKMTVTYQAPYRSLKSKVKSLTQRVISLWLKKSSLKKFQIFKPYVLYVGAAYPHKNLPTLLEAWKIFQNKYGRNYQLVLAGRKNYFYEKLLKQFPEIQDLSNEIEDRKGEIVYTGFVQDDDLNLLYQNASLYVFPSLYEGFGLPPLEAMVHNVPVVSSNRTCLPEVLGESVLYFDPENKEQMADIIYQGLTNSEIRYLLINNSKEELKKYSWDNLTVKTLSVYKSTDGS